MTDERVIIEVDDEEEDWDEEEEWDDEDEEDEECERCGSTLTFDPDPYMGVGLYCPSCITGTSK